MITVCFILFSQNYGAFFDLWGAGITGPVMLKGQNSTTDLSSNEWTYQVSIVFAVTSFSKRLYYLRKGE